MESKPIKNTMPSPHQIQYRRLKLKKKILKLYSNNKIMNKFNKTRLITHFAILKRDGHEN